MAPVVLPAISINPTNLANNPSQTDSSVNSQQL